MTASRGGTSMADIAAHMLDIRPLALQTWMSPAFPVGSFAYSHGLEWAAGCGLIRDRATAAQWLADLAAHGGLRNDAILLSVASRSVQRGDWAALGEANAMAAALAGSRERLLETVTQGNAFLRAIMLAWSNDWVAAARDVLGEETAYPVAVGAVCGAHAIECRDALRAFLAAAAGNMASALVRLAVIGQSDAQRVVAGLLPQLASLTAEARDASLDDLGGAAFISDIAAMAHETQETRLFRS